jgi:hypothetical protein
MMARCLEKKVEMVVMPLLSVKELSTMRAVGKERKGR